MRNQAFARPSGTGGRCLSVLIGILEEGNVKDVFPDCILNLDTE